MSEYGPVVELLAAIYDRMGNQITTTAAVGGAKNPPKSRPWPRPVTAFERAKQENAKAAFDDIVAAFAPHEVNGTT